VLAFDNLSGDPETAYFSDGVSEEILQTVARGAELTVIGRGSSFQFRGAEKAAGRVRATLRATHVLDGSVRRSGDRVRVAANLIECERETTIWSDRFDRELSDVFALQDEIAAAVASALNVVFRRRPLQRNVDPAAYDGYLKAVQLGTGSVLDEATTNEIVSLLEAAVNRSPDFARACALLATMRASRLRYGTAQLDYADEHAKVIEAAAIALRLDPSLGGVHHGLAELEAFGDFAKREAHYGRALLASPSDPQVLVAHAFFLGEVGRIEEALSQAKKAFDLDPMELGAGYAYASFLDFQARHDEARGLWDAFRRQWPRSGLMATGSIASALQDTDWSRFDNLIGTLAPETFTAGRARGLIWLGRALRDPQPARLARALQRANEELARVGTVALDRLTSLCALSLIDESFGLIDRSSFAYMFDPQLRWASGPLTGGFIFSRGGNLRMMTDIRFVGLCAKLGLGDYWIETGKWPDCADEVSYDFRAEARRLAGDAKRTSGASASGRIRP
jgi:TolB-like protein